MSHRHTQKNVWGGMKMMSQYDGRSNKEVEVIQVIRTTLLRMGEGTDKDPIRRIEQFWTLDGILLAENDPHLFKE